MSFYELSTKIKKDMVENFISVNQTKNPVSISLYYQEYRELSSFNRDVLKSLSPLINGTTHLEFFKNKTGELVFLEIAARSPGASVPYIYEINSGINYQEAFFKLQMNLDLQIISQQGPYAAWLWFPKTENAQIIHLNSPKVQSQTEIIWHVQKNECIQKSQTVRERINEIIIYNSNYQHLRNDFEYLKTMYQPCEF